MKQQDKKRKSHYYLIVLLLLLTFYQQAHASSLPNNFIGQIQASITATWAKSTKLVKVTVVIVSTWMFIVCCEVALHNRGYCYYSYGANGHKQHWKKCGINIISHLKHKFYKHNIAFCSTSE
ncbi:MAG: hypothetical protein ACPGC9_01000 [Cytophagales bacterium]